MSVRRTTKTPNSANVDEWRLEAVLASLLEFSDSQGRLLCPPFRILDCREEFPVYYEKIKNPIDLKMIAEKIRDEKYSSWVPFEVDIKLLCKNAKTFNEPGSVIYKDACKLLSYFLAKKVEFSASTKKLSQKEVSRNQELLSNLLDTGVSEPDNLSEDSEEDEDSESDADPKWILYWKIRNFDVVDGFPLCTHFLELPSKKCYPDYYDEIENPVSLYMINKQLKRGDFTDLQSLVKSLFQMFHNARSYNIERSEIYKAANKLETLTIETAKTLQPDIEIEVPEIVEEVEEKPSTSEKEKTGPDFSGKRLKKPGRRPLKRPRKVSESSNSDSPEFDFSVDSVKSLKIETDELSQSSSHHSSQTPPQQSSPSLPPAKISKIKRMPKERCLRRERRREKINAEKLKPGRKSLEELREKFSLKLAEVWKVAKDLKISNRSVAEHFTKLPSKDDYPDYFKVISKPIDMTIIWNKIQSEMYHNSLELLSDFTLMCENAKLYNRPDSQIYSDAGLIQSVVDSTLKSVTNNNTIYYPHRRTDKNWSQNSSITKQKLPKMKLRETKTDTNETPPTEGHPSPLASPQVISNGAIFSQYVSKPALTAVSNLPTLTTPANLMPGTSMPHLGMVNSNIIPAIPSCANVPLMPNGYPVYASPSAALPPSISNGFTPGASYSYAGVNGTPFHHLPSQLAASPLHPSQLLQHQQQLLYAQQRQLLHLQQFQSQASSSAIPPPMTNGALLVNSHSASTAAANGYHMAGYLSTASNVEQNRTLILPMGQTAEFLSAPSSVQVKRVMHSEAYVKYIESLYDPKQKTISKWDKTLQLGYRNTVPNYRKLPLEWIKKISASKKDNTTLSVTQMTAKRLHDNKLTKENGASKEEQEMIKSLWLLREQLLESTTGIQRFPSMAIGDSLVPNGLEQ